MNGQRNRSGSGAGNYYGENVASENDDTELSEDHYALRTNSNARNLKVSSSMRDLRGSKRRDSLLGVSRHGVGAASYSALPKRAVSTLACRTVSFSIGTQEIKVRAPGELPESRTSNFDKTVKRHQSLLVSKQQSGLTDYSACETISIPVPVSHDGSVPAPVPQEEEQNLCPICHEEETEGETGRDWAEIGDCSHKFHSVCILEYLRFSNRYACPMCADDINEVILSDKSHLTAQHLKEKFYTPPTGLIFNNIHNMSFFVNNEELKELPLTLTVNEDGIIVQQTALPTVILQIVDSFNRPCSLGSDEYSAAVEVSHDCPKAELFNASATIQGDGRVTLSNLVLQVSEKHNMHPDDVVTLRFEVVCEEKAEFLPCHGVSLIGSVSFPLSMRETHPNVLRLRRQQAAKEAAKNGGVSPNRAGNNSNSNNTRANTKENTATNGKSEPIRSRKPAQSTGCGCCVIS